MFRDIQELPKFSDGISYLFLEHCIVDQDAQSICARDQSGRIPIPCSALGLLMLGPGTSITHAAVKTLANSGCTVVWAGEDGVRFYANGMPETKNASNLIKQSFLVSMPELRLKVVRKMYQMRFEETLPDSLTIQQIRGMEGTRVRNAYARASKDTGVEWSGRSYKFTDWASSDPINRALSSANACLYGVTQAAIVTLGFSPGLGFIHTGKQLSFVYDIADMYKAETSIPVAFQAVAEDGANIEKRIRTKMREVINTENLLKRMVNDIQEIMSITGFDIEGLLEGVDDETAGMLWEGYTGLSKGGVDYSQEAGGDK